MQYAMKLSNPAYDRFDVCRRLQNVMDVTFDAGGKVSIGIVATTIVSQWIWADGLLTSTAMTTRVFYLITLQYIWRRPYACPGNQGDEKKSSHRFTVR